MARSSREASAGDVIAGTAIITFCCVATLHVPILGFVFFFLLPLPALFYHVRFGGHAALVISVLSILILIGFSREMNPDALLMSGMLGYGLLLGMHVKNHAPVEKTIAYSAMATLAALFFAILIIGNLTGTGGMALISAHVKKNLELTVLLYGQVDASGETARMLDASIEKAHYALLVILPALTAVMLGITGWINLLLGRTALKKASGFSSPTLGRLNLWQAPGGLVWGVIGCSLFLILPFQAAKIVALNILIVLMMVYLLQGFAIISFYFEKKKVPLFIRALIYIAVAIQQFLLFFIIGLGFFDTWLNVRRINKGENDPLTS